MKKQTEICQKCSAHKILNGKTLCTIDNYDNLDSVYYDRTVDLEDTDVPQGCLCKLDHLVLSQDMSSLS